MGIAASLRAVEHDLAQPVAVEPAQVESYGRRHVMGIGEAGTIPNGGILPLRQGTTGLRFVHESLAHEELDGTALHAKIGEPEPLLSKLANSNRHP
jgi:hypothetical protein